MNIEFYNTLTHKRERFEPLDPPNVTMYNCGPTVYDFAHIGNFRAFVFADVLRRFLELTGHKVQQVMNLTDVGHMTEDQLADGGGQDKMQVAAQRLKEAKKSGQAHAAAVEDPDDPYQVAKFYIDAFLEDARRLGLKIASDPANEQGIPKNMPRATEHVGKMMKIILQLVENGHAYVAADGAVYYAVESFPEYGRLSGNTLDKLRGGAGGRIQAEHQAGKRHPADFLLWKPDPSHIMKWESPWGVGYPGWHIECSAMALEVLSRLAGRNLETIDIHTGGEDNIFPHHECEIAQSCGATGKPLFARFWMHTRFLLVEGEKMSKSKGNFYTVRDVLEGKVTGRPVDPLVLRFELLKAHYMSNLNFTVESLESSAKQVDRWRTVIGHLKQTDRTADADFRNANQHNLAQIRTVLDKFVAALADNLNMSEATAVINRWLYNPFAAKFPDESLDIFRKINSVLQFVDNREFDEAAPENADEYQNVLCRQLDIARAAKDFAAADRIRKELIEAGYEVTTTKAGTTARKKLA